MTVAESLTVSVLGLGAMGSRMAARLLDAGYRVHVYNRSRERPAVHQLIDAGARYFDTPRAAVEGAQLVIAVVTDDDAARAIWLAPDTGALAALEADALAIESSTLTPGCVAELAEAFATTKRAFLDAPVVGTRPQAEAGALVHLVGGDAKDLERARPVLAHLGKAVHHLGPAGAGAKLKLVVNALFALQVAAMGELLGAAQNMGLDAGAALEVLGQLPVTSPAAKGTASLMLAGKFAPLFPIDLVEKDLRYMGEAADPSRVPLCAAARAVYAEAQAAGYGGDNIVGVGRLYL